jgi:UPF0716 protein FxsA
MALLVLLFIVVPLIELYVIIQVGEAIGVWWTIALLLVDSLIGSALMRSQGRSVWRRFQETVQAGRMPHREVADGALVILGGALLLTPGFVTDVFGLFLLLPPTRALVRGTVLRRVTFGLVSGRYPQGRGPRPPRDYDVEGTAVDSEQERLP